MTGLAWALIAVGGFVIFALGLWAFVRSGFPPRRAGEPKPARGEIPVALQQRRAWWGLAIGVALAAALVFVVALRGPANYSEDRTARLLTVAIFGSGVAAYFIMLALTRRAEGQSGVVMDERDRAIMTRALSVSLIAGFLTLVAWAIGLTEVYWEAGAIPIDFPTFIVWSTFIVALLGREIGVLMGYAGWHSHGES